jgi:AraC-like DNA-binding protein
VADGLRYRRMDTRAIPPADRFDYWRALVAPLMLEPMERPPRDFRVSAESLRFGGGVGLIEMDRGPATTRWSRETGLAQGRVRLVVLAAAPGAIGHWYGRDVPLTRGTAALLGPTDGWWRVPVRMRGIEVDLPRAAVPVSDTVLAQINAGRQLVTDPVYTSLVRPALLGMAGHLEQLATTRLDGLTEVWTSLVTMLAASVSGNGAAEVELAPARRVQATQFIAAHLADPDLGPDAVAAALHISRRSLYAALGTDEGGVAGQIRQARLAAAWAILADPADRRPIADIAAQVGLTSPAHFSRLFRRQYGRSPRELRAHPDRHRPDRRYPQPRSTASIAP